MKDSYKSLAVFGKITIVVESGKVKITHGDSWLVDYPINYGKNDKGEFLGTGYDGTFFYHQDWLDNQDAILEIISNYHNKENQHA